MQLPCIITTKTNIHYFVPGNMHVPLFPTTVECEVLAQDGTGAPRKGWMFLNNLELVEYTLYK